MAIPPQVIELDEEIDGGEIVSKNYCFRKLGEPVPVKSDGNLEFDPQCLPTQPLAVSERFQLLFVTHPQGFYVVKTKDVMKSAEEIKENHTGPSIEESSLVDVPIGKVSILAVSSDDSLLAASVANHVHFFAVSALLDKEQRPSYSVTLDDSIFIKDMRWARKVTKDYVILCANGKLYHGSGQGPLIYVMEGVDSVAWSIKGNFIAVAKKNTVSILSSELKEKLKFVLPFQSVIDGSDVNQVIKVDAIQWIRPDCIAVGCFQLNDDGEEESYVVQFITSRTGRITDASAASKPAVLSFSNVFFDFCSEAVPARNGPHLFLSYLSFYGLAFMANRNLSQEVQLFRWPVESGTNEASMVEFHNDNWKFHINLSQANGEANVILGLSVDKVCQDGNDKFVLGDRDTEVSPCCVVLCLTIDGKISVFHFASAIGGSISPEGCGSDEDDDASRLSMKHEKSPGSASGGESTGAISTSESHEFSRTEVGNTGSKATITNDLSPPFQVDVRPREQIATEKTGQKPLVDSETARNTGSKATITNDLSPPFQVDVRPREQIATEKTGQKPLVDSETARNTGSKAIITNDLSPPFQVDVRPREQIATEKTGQKPLVDSETARNTGSKATITNDLSPPFQVDVRPREQIATEKTGQKPLVDSETARNTGSKATITNDLSTPFQVDVRPREQIATEKTGQKPLVDSETAKVDEPKNVLSTMPNQDKNVENKSVFEVKHNAVSANGKALGDFPHPISNYAMSGSNVEPFVKGPLVSSPSLWPSTGSNARVDVSRTSGGSLLSLPSVKIDNSDNHVLLSTGGAREHPIAEKAKSSVTVASFGQTPLIAQGSRKSLSTYPVSQVPSTESVASGKQFQTVVKKELNAATSPPGLPHTWQNASKQFGNVEEMAKKLDNLLEGIVGKGGFRDASITSQANSVKDLEEGVWALSDRCRAWKGLLDDQLKEVQIVLDKTVQVLVRKLYMEGIFKQATDTRYWELWNRQKLSTELELKRRHILELNQELTNKLIELERHFNSLEFNKFGENGEMQRKRSVLQNSPGHSRQTQSLYSLHSTMQSQLAAAEQLSGCLSQQMASLSIESSGTHDVKKKIFESIGLSYAGETERSPARNGNFSTPSNKEHPITLGSTATKDQFRRNQTTIAKNYEPETARRRRDSLDHTWASYDPPKTTVKRMLKEDEKGSANRSLLNIDKQYLSPQPQKNTLGVSSNHYQRRGPAEISAKQFSQSPLTSSFQRNAGLLDRINQGSSTEGFSALPPPSILEARMTQNSEPGAFELKHGKSKGSQPLIGRADSFAAIESKFVQQSDASFHPLPSISTQLPEQSTPLSDSTDTSNRFKIGFSKSTTFDQKNPQLVSKTPLFDSKMPVAPTTAFSSGLNASEKGFFGKSSENPSLPNDSPSNSTTVFGSSLFSSSNLPSLSSFGSKPSSSTLFPVTPSNSGASVAAKQEVSLPPEAQTSLHDAHAAIYSSKTESASQTETTVVLMSSKTEKDDKIQASASQPGLTNLAADLKLGPSVSSKLTESSTDAKSGSQIDWGGLSESSSVTTSVIKSQPSTAEALSPVPLSSVGVVGSAKSVVSDSSHEEEMEEEAPETGQTTELALGSLDGFGIGSTANSTTPKSNPFGVAVPNKNTNFTTSPYTMSPSGGELFRPASFNFQPPKALEPVQPTAVSYSGGFSSGIPGQVPAGVGFGQPANVGVGAGQQALGSVLGSFGQSRQIGAGLPGSNVASASGFGSGFTPGGFGGGFTSASSGGGFGDMAGGGGFAAAGRGVGGFAAAATAGGFAAAATTGGGFSAVAGGAGGGFGSSATSSTISGGGFGAFNSQQGGGGFSAFSGSSGAARPPSEFFTQMRR